MAANYLGVHGLYLDYLNAVEDEEGERILQRRNDYENMSEEQFLERYRLSKTVVGKVHSEIEERLVHLTNMRFPFSPIQ